MTNIELTVVIPTFNRANKLKIALKNLKDQTLKNNLFEVIVVDDGSEDKTQDIVKSFKNWKNLTYIKQKNLGQGVARNNAIAHAKGKTILFLGDDIYADKNLLKKHFEFHSRYSDDNFACLGLIEWYKKIKLTKFMKWLTNGGPQFAFKKLTPGAEATFWHFYTSNISLKKSLLDIEKFDEKFKSYGWEDIELAYRLTKKFNLKIIFEPKALAFHDHYMQPSSLKDRMFNVGKNSVYFEKEHPELKVSPRGLKKIIFLIIGSWPFLAISNIISKKLYWYALSKHYFLKGLRSA